MLNSLGEAGSGGVRPALALCWLLSRWRPKAGPQDLQDPGWSVASEIDWNEMQTQVAGKKRSEF